MRDRPKTRETDAKIISPVLIMSVLHRLGVKVRAGARHVWGNKVKIATAVGGVFALGKKIADHKDTIQSLHSDVVEAQHTARAVQSHAQDVSGVRSAVGTARAVQGEISEARDYRDTRRDAASRGVQMDPRPVHQAKAKTSAKTQARHIDDARDVAKARCMAKAAQLSGRKRNKAVKKCG